MVGGIVMETKEEQLQNASYPKEVTVGGIVIEDFATCYRDTTKRDYYWGWCILGLLLFDLYKLTNNSNFCLSISI